MNPNDPYYPSSATDSARGVTFTHDYGPVTTCRDHIAIAAMQGLLSNTTEDMSPIRAANWAYRYADAMIAESNKETPTS